MRSITNRAADYTFAPGRLRMFPRPSRRKSGAGQTLRGRTSAEGHLRYDAAAAGPRSAIEGGPCGVQTTGLATSWVFRGVSGGVAGKRVLCRDGVRGPESPDAVFTSIAYFGRGACVGQVLALTPAVVAIIASIATFVPLPASVPPMVMADVAASALPATGEILSIDVVRHDPVRALVRRPRPVAVVPSVMRSLRILVALDPDIVGAGASGHTVRTRPWRFADVDTDGYLCMGRGSGSEKQCRDRERVKQLSHVGIFAQSAMERLFRIAQQILAECAVQSAERRHSTRLMAIVLGGNFFCGTYGAPGGTCRRLQRRNSQGLRPECVPKTSEVVLRALAVTTT
jgi:hypothetical protein